MQILVGLKSASTETTGPGLTGSNQPFIDATPLSPEISPQ